MFRVDYGDEFVVDLYIDKRYGSLIFKTTGGRSKCPHEPGTQGMILEFHDQFHLFTINLLTIAASSTLFDIPLLLIVIEDPVVSQ